MKESFWLVKSDIPKFRYFFKSPVSALLFLQKLTNEYPMIEMVVKEIRFVDDYTPEELITDIFEE